MPGGPTTIHLLATGNGNHLGVKSLHAVIGLQVGEQALQNCSLDVGREELAPFARSVEPRTRRCATARRQA